MFSRSWGRDRGRPACGAAPPRLRIAPGRPRLSFHPSTEIRASWAGTSPRKSGELPMKLRRGRRVELLEDAMHSKTAVEWCSTSSTRPRFRSFKFHLSEDDTAGWIWIRLPQLGA
jgi:hypothetical protein